MKICRNGSIIAPLIIFLLAQAHPAFACHVVKVSIRQIKGTEAAYATFEQAGVVRGARGNPGSAAEQQRQLTPEENSQLWSRIQSVGPRFMGAVATPPAGDHQVVEFQWDTGQRGILCWPAGQDHPDPEVKALYDNLYKYRIGNW